MTKQVFALISAILMLAVGCAVVVDAADESTACNGCNCMSPEDVTVTGSVNVYYYTNNNWTSTNVAAYDLKQAVDAAASVLNYTVTYAAGASSWADGYNPALNYGEIATVNNNATFSIFVCNSTSANWTVAQDAIGWYRPFSDYASTTFPDLSSAGASNIAIVPGVSTGTIPAGATGTIGLTQVTQTAEYRYCFHLQGSDGHIVIPDNYEVTVYNALSGFTTTTLTASMLANGIVIYGYGSDGYQALKNALPGQVVGQEVTFELHTNPNNTTYYTFYSWMDTVFGAGTITEYLDGGQVKYTFWSSYTCDHTPTSYDWLDYTFGYYSKLVGNYNPACGFTYNYEVSIYPWN